jgi:secondary thiamine-phosphate synthase enzyme
MAMHTSVVEIDTSRRRITDVTEHVMDFCHGRADGLVSVFVPHATAGLALMELGSGSETDLEELVQRLLPRDDRYRHRHGSRGHGADHLLPVLVNPTLVLPVIGGEPALGTWQRIALVDFNPDNPRRQVRLSHVPADH